MTAGFVADTEDTTVAVVEETGAEGVLSTLSVVPKITGLVTVAEVDVTTPKLKVEFVGLDAILEVPKAKVVDDAAVVVTILASVVATAGIPKLNSGLEDAAGIPKENVTTGVLSTWSAAPNLNPPLEAGVSFSQDTLSTPNLNCEGVVGFAKTICWASPGLGASQHAQDFFSGGFRTMQLAHSQLDN